MQLSNDIYYYYQVTHNLLLNFLILSPLSRFRIKNRLIEHFLLKYNSSFIKIKLFCVVVMIYL